MGVRWFQIDSRRLEKSGKIFWEVRLLDYQNYQYTVLLMGIYINYVLLAEYYYILALLRVMGL